MFEILRYKDGGREMSEVLDRMMNFLPPLICTGVKTC